MPAREDYVIRVYGEKCLLDEVGVKMYEEDADRIKSALMKAALTRTTSRSASVQVVKRGET